jgi:1,4-alpha-glucan branching enzyme
MLAQDNINAATPTGSCVRPDGATFRVWAPRASAVYLNGNFGGATYDAQTEDRLLQNDGTGYWTGFQAGAVDGDTYRFWVAGSGASGYKRDPYARELSPEGFPNCLSILRATDLFPWHDTAFRTPDFSDMIIYQLHIGTYAISKPNIASNILDAAGKVPYLAALGINVLQPLPVDEQEANPSMGYGGADLFCPDFPYVAAEGDLPGYLVTINDILAAKALAPLTLADILSGPGQLKALVDLCHVHGIAVTFDVVYNHGGGFTVNNQLDGNCIYYFDQAPNVGDNNDSLYFTNQDRGTGGLAFALWNQDVCRFLHDNAAHYITEYHADGFRYDEISILLSCGQATGWSLCRGLTSALRSLQPRLLQNAEFWPGEFDDIPTSATPIVSPPDAGGAGFDVVQHDALRDALRGAVGAASAGAGAAVSMSSIAGALYPPGLDHGWRAVTCIENHDLVYAGRNPRVPSLADSPDPHSWYARSRTRAATAMLLTAPGIPQLFMGQEFLEQKPWDTNPAGQNLIGWAGLQSGADPAMTDHLRFTQDLVRLRQTAPALRGDNVHAYYVSDGDRVLAYHRWIDYVGLDVIVVATFAEATWWDYALGFPFPGEWTEVFNSDVYDNWANPWVAGNGGAIEATGGPLHGFTASASVVIPANGAVIFARR